jgi:hypothetical protein
MDDDREMLESDLPEEMTMPFGGLLKDTIYNRVLAFIVADPNSDYRVKEMAMLVGGNRSKVGDALRDLEKQGLLANVSHDKRHPLYRPRHDSLRLRALVFLAYAVVDDREGTSLMESSVMEFSNLGNRSNRAEEETHAESGDEGAIVRGAPKAVRVR